MIPVRLNLRNFMCYTDVHRPLEFDGMHTACLSGANGHGKSALLDAMTWALWGRSRSRKDDELIHLGNGVNEMEVEFEFRLDDQQYRVIRKRSKRGRGQSVLELGVRDNGEYRVLTGNSLADTQQEIDGLLRMSYETFVNSSFILQGKADSFTTKQPSERKQILAEILDLSYYDVLEEHARRKAAEYGEKQAVLRQQIEDDDAELAQQPALRQQQATLESDLESLETDLKRKEAQCEALRARLSALQAGERELREQQRRLEEATGYAERERARVAEAEAAMELAQECLEHGALIEQGYARLLERRAECERLASGLAEHNRLSQEAAALEQKIAQARGQLEGRQKQLSVQLAGFKAEADALDRYQGELAKAKAEQQQVDRLEAKRTKLEQAIAEEVARFREAEAVKKHNEEQHGQMRQRRGLLKESSTCPLCKTELSGDRHQHVMDQYEADARRTAELISQAEAHIEQIKASGSKLKAELKELGDLAAQRKQLQERLTEAERALARAEEQARAVSALTAELKNVEAELARAGYCRAEQGTLEKLRAEIAALGYDSSEHEAAKAALEEESKFEALRQELLDARKTLEQHSAAREQAQQGLAEWEAQAVAAEKRISELLTETADLATVDGQVKDSEAELAALRSQLGRLNQELGGIRQRLSTMEFLKQRRSERRDDLQNVLLERSLYQELAQAFGKKGLQAMLIETAIPELEDEANRLLGVMTDGRMQVSFHTQRPTRGGEAIETLDIKIKDDLGERPYELYSGGEAFRVNFAIRIALSHLLAQRAGAKLQTLVVDEGFGSQDADGRARLVEAIRAVQPEFEKILVITHLDELREMFPVRIEVNKTPAGSTIEVS
jgi:exonuclease SbcC